MDDWSSNNLKIETIKTSSGEVSYCSARGGIITSLKLNDKELLYMDESTFINVDGHVRGGIPILFPNAGALESAEYPDLAQHGFARNSKDWKTENFTNGFMETLESSDESLKSYPYNFALSIEGKFEENGSFTITQKVLNTDKEKSLPISMGFHPYFKVPKDQKKNIEFNFQGGEFVKEKEEDWINGKYISIDNPKTKDPNAVIEITISSLGTLVMDASIEYEKIWIWSLPDKDFICIEPVMRDEGSLATNPVVVKAGESLSVKVNFQLK